MMSPAPPCPDDPSASVCLRPEQPDDEPFLFDVYVSTRAEELALTGWDETTCRRFLDMQFTAMRRGYGSMYPAGEFLIICQGAQRIGRLVLDRGASEIRVVDLALLPGHREKGIGTLLMRQVCEAGARAGKPVRLCVLKQNRAVRWYERLGFRRTGETGIYDEMEWRPTEAGMPASANPPSSGG